MLPQSASKTALKAIAVSEFLNSKSMRKLTFEPRSPIDSKCHWPVRLRNGAGRLQEIVRREPCAQDSARDAERGEPFALPERLDRRAVAPWQELGIARDIVDQSEHLGRRVGDDCAAFDMLQ